MNKKAHAYTDGSYNNALGIYGCGAVLLIDGEEPQIFYETGRAAAGKNGWNINGEIRAAEMVVEKAVLAGVKELVIHHDYEGVGKWPDGLWRANQDYTRQYAETINRYRKQIKICFDWVRGHSGNKWNDLADRAAKYGAKINDKLPTLSDIEVNADSVSANETTTADVLTAAGRKNIKKFLTLATPSFKDFIVLKTGGRDRFSELGQQELETVIGTKVCEYVENSVNDRSGYTSALRWILRGLSPEDAVHKVNVDIEVAANTGR